MPAAMPAKLIAVLSICCVYRATRELCIQYGFVFGYAAHPLTQRRMGRICVLFMARQIKILSVQLIKLHLILFSKKRSKKGTRLAFQIVLLPRFCENFCSIILPPFSEMK
jgi:hypothetical protein